MGFSGSTGQFVPDNSTLENTSGGVAQIKDSGVTVAKMSTGFWKKVYQTTLSSAATSVTITGLSNKKYLLVYGGKPTTPTGTNYVVLFPNSNTTPSNFYATYAYTQNGGAWTHITYGLPLICLLSTDPYSVSYSFFEKDAYGRLSILTQSLLTWTTINQLRHEYSTAVSKAGISNISQVILKSLDASGVTVSNGIPAGATITLYEGD